jgi:mannose/cellobiose epimerase-like protein (N-acyl-D-glucosamine 2-epimerase family)
MIALGMAAEFARHEAGVAATEMGLRLARRVLYGHVNLGSRWPALQSDDLSEFITPAGAPYADEAGRVISDPGHSLEFVGLFLKFSAAVRAGGQASPEQWGELLHMHRLMPAILRRAFGNGFRPVTGGIIKSLDLVTRAPIDDTMPWWSLPETIRAGLGAAATAASEEARAACLGIAAQCHNALVKHYVRPDVHLMAVKLRDAAGHVSDIVPAYPDADPGYHTALSLIDALALLPDAQTS